MKLREIEVFHIELPLKRKIKHASRERTTSDSLVVAAKLDNGAVGYGEGVPRSYVTGETIESSFDMLMNFDAAKAVGEVDSFERAGERIAAFSLPEIENDPRGMFGNAARSALELALWDAFGKAYGKSLSDGIAMLEPLGGRSVDRVRYSGAITAESRRGETISAWKMRLYGFQHVKVKVGIAGQDDPERLARFRRILGRRKDLRLDANEAWPAHQIKDRVRALAPFRPSLIEQPSSHAEVGALGELRPELGVPVMLDESLCGYPDALASIRGKTADYFNLRLSKCGGVAPTLKIAELAADHGIRLQLGCHPGETGLLSAAGRHMAACLGKTFDYVEGSYDRHILETNITTPDITFGYGGRARAIAGPGLGVSVNADALRSLTAQSRKVVYD